MRKSITIFGIIMVIMGIILMIKDVVVPMGIAVYYGIYRNADIIWGDNVGRNLVLSALISVLMYGIGYITLMYESDKEFDK